VGRGGESTGSEGEDSDESELHCLRVVNVELGLRWGAS
jgi:hypothetical protein